MILVPRKFFCVTSRNFLYNFYTLVSFHLFDEEEIKVLRRLQCFPKNRLFWVWDMADGENIRIINSWVPKALDHEDITSFFLSLYSRVQGKPDKWLSLKIYFFEILSTLGLFTPARQTQPVLASLSLLVEELIGQKSDNEKKTNNMWLWPLKFICFSIHFGATFLLHAFESQQPTKVKIEPWYSFLHITDEPLINAYPCCSYCDFYNSRQQKRGSFLDKKR